MSGVHANTAVVLRMLAASPQPEFFSRLTDEGSGWFSSWRPRRSSTLMKSS
jgi:hypothetical protein